MVLIGLSHLAWVGEAMDVDLIVEWSRGRRGAAGCGLERWHGWLPGQALSKRYGRGARPDRSPLSKHAEQAPLPPWARCLNR